MEGTGLGGGWEKERLYQLKTALLSEENIACHETLAATQNLVLGLFLDSQQKRKQTAHSMGNYWQIVLVY